MSRTFLNQKISDVLEAAWKGIEAYRASTSWNSGKITSDRERVHQALDEIVKRIEESAPDLIKRGFEAKAGKGVGRFPNTPWVSLSPPSQTVASGVYGVACIDGAGSGYVVGPIVSISDKKVSEGLSLIKRPKATIKVDVGDYNDAFLAYTEVTRQEAASHDIVKEVIAAAIQAEQILSKRTTRPSFTIVERMHVLSSLADYAAGRRPEGFDNSTSYDLLHEGRTYPPKMIMGIAYKLATGETITGEMFDGGLNTPCFRRYEELGFKIVPKATVKPIFMKINHKLACASSAKPFTILAGGTGTGKTRAAKLMAASIAGRDNVEVVAVGADWTDNRPLLGFRNLLAEGGKTYVAPPALRIILKALGNPGKPHFLILDEMNLSHVERYFADFLSSMESKEPLKLHDSAEDLKTEDAIMVKCKVEWPGNLFVIGTVNIDETTYMFSPKVLDRAHVIEFKVPWDEIEAGLGDAVPGEIPQLTEAQVGEFMRVAGSKDKTLADDEHAALVEVLGSLHEALDGTRFVFAHRTARECLNFIASAKALAAASIVPDHDTTALIDLAILQKALPKLNGAAGTLSKVLDDLIKVADTHDLEQCKAKLESMSRQLKADQFVSFIQ